MANQPTPQNGGDGPTSALVRDTPGVCFAMFLEQAQRRGAMEVRTVRADAFANWETDAPQALHGVTTMPLCHDPRQLLTSACSVLVLFFSCPPFEASDSPFARYYTVSQHGYFAARALVEDLHVMGISAVHGTALPHRAAALRSGGTIGDNGLYYHEKWGSYVHIELIVNDAFSPDADGAVQPCSHCGRCRQACPTGALCDAGRKMEDCIRNYMYATDMPPSMRAHVNMLLGCERCQRVCPINAGIQMVPIQEHERDAMSLERLIGGSLAPTRALIGKNLARRKRMVRQATLVIGAKRLSAYADMLKEQQRAGSDNAYLRWALSRIIDENARI